MSRFDTMKNKELLIRLIEHLDFFEAENKHLEHYTLEDFLSYLQSHSEGEEKVIASRPIAGNRKPAGFEFHTNTAILLSRQIGLIYRYARGYTKKALEGSELRTVEEFSYLVVLMTFEHLSKTALILKNVMGKTSGMAVIKRLLRKGLIRQFDDKDDKRHQLVAITPKGLKEMKQVFPKMQGASELIKGNLDASEQQMLTFLLQKLEAWHNDRFLRDRKILA